MNNLNNINFESDLSTIQFRLTFKGHISTEYCCLVMNLASISTISYADSNDGIFLLVGSLGCVKPEILGLTQSLSRPDCTSAFSRRNANLFLLNCDYSNKLFLLDCSQFKRNRRNISHFADKKRPWNQAFKADFQSSHEAPCSSLRVFTSN